VNPKQLDKVLHTHAGSNVIIKLSIGEKGKPANVVVKELQVDNIKGHMKHVDFCSISLDRKIRSSIPFKIVGESQGVKEGGIIDYILRELEVECLPMDIPDGVEVDVTELEIGDKVSVSQITVPDNVTIVTDLDNTILHVVAPRVEEEPEVEEEAELEGEEPEVISDADKAEKKDEAAEGETKDAEK
jgi:large subunit ribosomal protein L25